jgi:hypothetical protein
MVVVRISPSLFHQQLDLNKHGSKFTNARLLTEEKGTNLATELWTSARQTMDSRARIDFIFLTASVSFGVSVKTDHLPRL